MRTPLLFRPKKILTYRKRHGIVCHVPHTDRYTQAKVAQLVEHSTENAGVVGSIPSLGTFCYFPPNFATFLFIVHLLPIKLCFPLTHWCV
jgi:hypothetical protein